LPWRAWLARAEAQPGAPGFRVLTVSRDDWRRLMEDVRASGGQLVALWAGAQEQIPTVRAALLGDAGGLIAILPLSERAVTYPGLADLFPAAARMQRALADLSGVRSTDPDQRPWLRHSAWPEGYHPLVDSSLSLPNGAPVTDRYEFARVEGEGVHEIPVGPVHAGTIEPGHFRFSVVGEKILKLEERLGYVHKGIDRRFAELPILEAHQLAARVSGDSAVAFSWAYTQALEGMALAEVPARGSWLRALCLELERLSNHLGDLGALGNDAGFAFGLTQFSRLKEHLLRAMHDTLGGRYLMNAIVPGGSSCDLTESGLEQLGACVRALAQEVQTLRSIYEEHDGLRDRFTGAGTILPELAARLGLTGLAARASGQALDLRTDLPCTPYVELAPQKCGRNEGDVAARVAVRFDEVEVSCQLVAQILHRLPFGPCRSKVEIPLAGAFGVGLIEGWRGPVLVALEAGAAGTIRRCHVHDPSWQNWPVLEHAVIGNIVPDFPLINKSFNLSYSGHDL
jgi:Ni,Fe-hydrogenase III large subunit